MNGHFHGWDALEASRKVLEILQKQVRIDAAVHDTLAGVLNSFRSAAIAYKVPPQTARDRALGKRVPQKSLVNEAQEKVLVDWCYHNSDSATPLHPQTLRGRVLEMVAIYPGKNWACRFLSRHPGALGLSRDEKIADLSARIKAHLEDPETRNTLSNNPRFLALYGSERCIGTRATNSTMNGESSNSASASHPVPVGNLLSSQLPPFSQIQALLLFPYPNHWLNHIGIGSSSLNPPPTVATASTSS
ncbi:hypothetical protein K503DRAFT_869045 [Rhizopogon vinicolor AM-OR11-026]|uniref:HTH CENPB-type domain-containing protein n=1 Tax=Rhizopogon vinicolor AM-OR11-026 TaxID=1314800 RepID=A0A1B7MNS5_9AGAM|nr:hypothetical protein K503DRAFT_869045 [Rhizopogon vinicolor AM-OR11-026]